MAQPRPIVQPVHIVGGGLAGCEAAWQLARRGVDVRLYEMKPAHFSPAHRSPDLAELVCSNSLRSDDVSHAVGLLHEELRRLDSLVLRVADCERVPAGSALAVDRVRFSRGITELIAAEPRIELVREELQALPEGTVIVATGPLTSDALARALVPLCRESLYFYDSISPTVYADSLDASQIFAASRWDVDGSDYLNCPLDREQYHALVAAIVAAEKIALPDFERPLYFEGCLPIEVMAERAPETLSFGPFKPVGLTRDADVPALARFRGRTPHAVVQLRREDQGGTLYNLVGCQTRMKSGEQKRIFRMLPGLERAVFARLGSVHRNTFIRSPELLSPRLEHRARSGLYFAGQITGVEGYVESTALGWLAGVFVAFRAEGGEAPLPPETSALAALLRHIGGCARGTFQPSNVTYGLFPLLSREERHGARKDRHARMSERALRDLEPYRERVGLAARTLEPAAPLRAASHASGGSSRSGRLDVSLGTSVVDVSLGTPVTFSTSVTAHADDARCPRDEVS
jgi:methylenetetrahydrofolate--tRNA-(uracil-5-)-methyltransferase